MDPGPTTSAPTQRTRLARAALAAARGHAAVAGGHAGPDGRSRTQDGDGWLTGVTVVAEPAGRYSVDLHLVCRAVPLHDLARQIAELTREAAAERGLGPVVGTVTVTFEDLAEEPS